MSEQFRYRRYRNGDADKINRLYKQVTGRERSLSEFDWQWREAPGGPAEIWLIEAVSGGDCRLVGHHGVMPVRFSHGAEDLLFGKTENTMVHADYRRKILYPRFERRFAREYEPRFDALFSTIGPAAAIRQRQALGYRSDAKWVRVRIPTSIGGELRSLWRRLIARGGTGELAVASLRTDPRDEPAAPPAASAQGIRALTDKEAQAHPFFARFWPERRNHYGLTPSRCRADLDWRFWSNPHAAFTTLIADENGDEPGYAVIRRNPVNPRAANIDDIVPVAPTAVHMAKLLHAVLEWLRVNRVDWADFSTTQEAGDLGVLGRLFRRRDMRLRRLRGLVRTEAEIFMPRRVTPTGSAKNLDGCDWYVTPFVFEGRR